MLGLDDLGVDPRPGQGGERRMMIPAVVAQGVTLGHHPRHQSRVLGDLLPDLAEVALTPAAASTSRIRGVAGPGPSSKVRHAVFFVPCQPTTVS
jgi:hypothetical protein